jgi:RNA polymerase sigma-70 factor (ECF subfamily)
MPDRLDLLELCRKGDAKAQRVLYDLSKDKLMGLCRRYAKNREEAQDILQESFLKIFTMMDQLESPDKLEAWMKSVAIHTAINHYHRTKNDKLLISQQSEDVHDLVEPPIEQMTDEYLVSLVNALPDGCRTVFNLFCIEGYSHAEIAELLQISEGTSRSQLHHAKVLLKGKLKCHSLACYYEKFA